MSTIRADKWMQRSGSDVEIEMDGEGMSVPLHIIQALIELGTPDGAPDQRALLDVLDPYARAAHNHNPNGEWRRLASSMEPNELRCLIRGVVLAEELGKWYGGSVSIVIPLFRAYQDKRPDDETQVAEWVMRNSSNPYAPTGRDRGSASSLAELQEQNAREYVRKESAAVVEKRRAEEGVQRRKEAAERYVRRMEGQEAATADRKAEIERLRGLPSDERLRFLLGVPPRSFGYYPVALLSDDPGFEGSLSKAHRSELVRLIRTSGDRAWMKWAKDTFGPFGEISDEAQK